MPVFDCLVDNSVENLLMIEVMVCDVLGNVENSVLINRVFHKFSTSYPQPAY